MRKASSKDRLVVHSSMERDVGLLRLFPGIPASLVGLPGPSALRGSHTPRWPHLPPRMLSYPLAPQHPRRLVQTPLGTEALQGGTPWLGPSEARHGETS